MLGFNKWNNKYLNVLNVRDDSRLKAKLSFIFGFILLPCSESSFQSPFVNVNHYGI